MAIPLNVLNSAFYFIFLLIFTNFSFLSFFLFSLWTIIFLFHHHIPICDNGSCGSVRLANFRVCIPFPMVHPFIFILGFYGNSLYMEMMNYFCWSIVLFYEWAHECIFFVGTASIKLNGCYFWYEGFPWFDMNEFAGTF
jgi:hypothetical protein